VLLLEPLQLLLRLLVIKALTLELPIKATYLNLKIRYLSFQICKLVFSKGKLLTENRRRAMLSNQFFNAVED